MKVGFIVPIKYLNLSLESDFHLILPHIVEKYPEYGEFYKRRIEAGDFVMLDNSAFELGKPIDAQIQKRIAYELNVNEVVLPDFLSDSKETLKSIEKTLSTVYTNNDFSIAAVSQGKDIESYIDCFRQLVEIKEINTVCMPAIIEFPVKNIGWEVPFRMPEMVLRRIYLIEHLYERGIINELIKSRKQIHLLGSYDQVELYYYRTKGYNFVRSNDSSSAFVHGQRGIRYTLTGLPCKKIEEKIDFGCSNLTEYQIDCVKHNMNMIKWFAQGGWVVS